MSPNSTSLQLTLEPRECRLTSQNELKMPGDGKNEHDWFLSIFACCRLGANLSAKTDVTVGCQSCAVQVELAHSVHWTPRI